MKKILSISSVAFLLPFVTLAVNNSDAPLTIIEKVGGWIDTLVPIVMTLALLYFFYGLAKYIMNAGDEAKAKEGKSIMIYGIIALFVMVSVWGVVYLLQGTLEVPGDANTTVTLPSTTY